MGAEDLELDVTEVAGASAALNQLHEASKVGRPFDVAFLDRLLPGSDGKEFASSIKSNLDLRRTRLILMNQLGQTVVFKPDPDTKKLEIVATNEIAERTNSTLAISDGEIFLRTHKHLYCIAERDDG